MNQVKLHQQLFTRLVDDWRTHWKKPELPFYYTQLSSINRPDWGKFRNSQRELLSVPNTGMAVTYDVGHPNNVHPNYKWIVGERLARIALAKNYSCDIAYSGPMLDFINVKNDTLEVYFQHAEGLKTVDGSQLKDIQIAGIDKVYSSANSKIENNVLRVWSDKVDEPRYVKYAHTSFTAGNLVNKFDLPAPTFTNEICE